MQTALEAFKSIEKKAESSTPSVRRIERDEIGQGVRQGDVYLIRLGAATKDAPEVLALVSAIRKSAKPGETTLKSLPETIGEPTRVRQVAVGDTVGSRHVAEGSLTIYAAPAGAHALVGPIVVAFERWRLTHPEHGHFDLGAGCYQVLYQRDFKGERANEIRRVAD